MNHATHDIRRQCYSRFGSCVNHNGSGIVTRSPLEGSPDERIGITLRPVPGGNQGVHLRIRQDPVHAIRANHRPIALFQRHDRVVSLHATRLPGSQRLRHDIRRWDHPGRPGGRREVAGLLQRRVVVRELPDPASTHDVGARVPTLKDSQ